MPRRWQPAHFLGDTGDFSNTIFTGHPQPFANGTVTPFIENDQVLGNLDSTFGGTLTDPDETAPVPVGYLNEATILAGARATGFGTAAVGKLGPTAIFAHANSALLLPADQDSRGTPTIIVDDRTGSATGIPISASFAGALAAAGLPVAAPGRGANGAAGSNAAPGTKLPNNIQQDYFVEVTTDVLLPEFAAAGRPFLLVFWSRDPDGTQHNQGDSPNAVNPGINGPTSLAAVANADSDLSRIIQALDQQGLTASTDLIVVADHGFSTIAKLVGPALAPSATSFAATQTYLSRRGGALVQEVQTGFLPPGMVAIDLSHALAEPLFDPDGALPTAAQPVMPVAYPPVIPTQPPAADGSVKQRPTAGNGVIGADPSNPDVVVAANGGSDLIYLPNPATAAALAPQVITALLGEDYVSGLFVDDARGAFPGTLPLSKVGLKGAALTPTPAIVVNFASYTTAGQGCVFATSLLCTVEIADTTLQQGQGMHGSFSRADTNNFMAAIGPDFQAGFRDPAPVSNADIGKTVAHLMGIALPSNGRLKGRVISEAMPGGSVPGFTRAEIRSEPAANGQQTILRLQSVGDTLYFDAAGFADRSVVQ